MTRERTPEASEERAIRAAKRRARLKAAWRRAVRSWPVKVGAVAAALVLWWVAATDPGQTSQRSLLVPLQVTGVAPDEVPVGVPSRVEVVMVGGSTRMDRLRAEEIEVVLDLTGASGEFARRIEARAPAALRVERVVPSEIIGRVEAVRSGSFPVTPVVLAAGDVRPILEVTLEPAQVSVEARDPVLAQVRTVIASVLGPVGGEVLLVPLDQDGRPVEGARVVPDRVQVQLVRGREAAEGRALLAVVPPGGATLEAVSHGEVRLLGPAAALADLDQVLATVAVPTGALAAGRYDLPLRLQLPDGVVALDRPTVRVRVDDASGNGAAPTP